MTLKEIDSLIKKTELLKKNKLLEKNKFNDNYINSSSIAGKKEKKLPSLLDEDEKKEIIEDKCENRNKKNEKEIKKPKRRKKHHFFRNAVIASLIYVGASAFILNFDKIPNIKKRLPNSEIFILCDYFKDKKCDIFSWVGAFLEIDERLKYFELKKTMKKASYNLFSLVYIQGLDGRAYLFNNKEKLERQKLRQRFCEIEQDLKRGFTKEKLDEFYQEMKDIFDRSEDHVSRLIKSACHEFFSGRDKTKKYGRKEEYFTDFDDEQQKQLNEVLNQSKEILYKIGDTQLGKGKTEKITKVIEEYHEGKISQREYLENIIKEVPTGLPSGLDSLIKKSVIDYSIKNMGD